HCIRRAVIGAPATVGAGIEIEHVLPCEIFEGLNAKGFHLIQLLIADTPADGFDRSFVQLREVNVEQRRFHMELNSEGPIAQQEVKSENIQHVSAAVEVPKRRLRS